MGEPDDGPQRVDARLLRAHDLVDLRLEAPGCTIEPSDTGAALVAGPDAVLIVHFPPQHLGEEVWQAGAPPPWPLPPTRPSQHRASGPTRLVYELAEGTRIPYTLAGVLEALPGLTLRVSPLATPWGEAAPEDRDPEPPSERETAIEAPYRLVVSPSVDEAFVHDATPTGPPDRPELWRTHLTVRPVEGERAGAGKTIVRGLWNRDRDHPDPPFPQAPTPADRTAIVDQTHGGNPANARTPLEVASLRLSSLGAWFDWTGAWDFPADVVDYRHQAFMGRDGYVRVVYPGFLYWCGHRCYLVKVTEREVRHRATPVAYLWQRWFLLVRQPTRTYPPSERDNPFGRVSVSPLVTPDIDPPPPGVEPFVPTRNGVPFPFTLTTVDRGGQTQSWSAPLVFVHAGAPEGRPVVHRADLVPDLYRPVQVIPGRGQTLAVAEPVRAGDTSVEVTHLVFTGTIDVEEVTSRPSLASMRAVVPSMRHLAPQAPAVDLELAKPYLLHGLPRRALDAPPVPGAPNSGELVLALTSPPPAVDFSTGSDRAGGFVSPNLSVQGLSRALGAVGEDGTGPSAFEAGRFDPKELLSGAFPKLFGLFDLLELLQEAGFDEAPAFVSDALDALTRLLTEAQRLQAALGEAQARLAAEVAAATHGGAQAVAQQARDALDAHAGALGAHLGDLVAAVQGLPGSTDPLRDASAALAADLQPLLDALALPGFPAALRASLTTPVQVLRTLTDLVGSAAGLVELLEGVVGGQVTARLSWRPLISAWGLPGIPAIFDPQDDHGLHLDVEVTASATAPPSVAVVAEIVDFHLNLVGDAETALMRLEFRRIGFHAGSSGKPEVDVVFGGMGFLGPLSFVERLRELIPFDGFSDPPYVDVGVEGVTAGFDLALPNVAVGVFSLENIVLGADARVPFLGDAMTVGFRFCSKDAPFRLTVSAVGGGGWLGLRASPKGLVLLELGLEAAAALSVDLGVASGSVSVAVGVYLRLEAANGVLTAYFRIRGEVDVLGLISASITLELSLTYEFPTGKLVGRASLVVEVEVLFFSASVEIVVERRLAGSKGDPTLRDVMPPDDDGSNADWALYCDAFAPVPA